MMKTRVIIQNLKCGGCANTINKKLESLDGITEITIELEDSSVTFTHPSKKEFETVHKALSKLGYPIEGDENTFGAKAKSYVSCAVGRINK
jgi:copper chaperone CopZ